MEFTEESLQLIQETAVKAAGATGKAEILKLPAEPEHVYAVVKANGDVEVIAADPAPRQHTLASLDQVIQFASDKGHPEKSAVWYDRSAVVVILDDETRRDVATLKLRPTPQLETLLAVEKRGAMQQRALPRLAKENLRAAIRLRKEATAPVELRGTIDHFRALCQLCKSAGLAFDIALQLEATE